VNERERLLRVLEGGKADQTPWYADLSWWYAAHAEMDDLPAAYEDDKDASELFHSHFQLVPTVGQGYLRLHQDIGAGICFYAPMVWKETFSEEIRFTSQKEANRTISRIITPVGQLDSVSEYLPHSCTTAYKTHYIKQPADLEVIRYIWEHRTISPNYEEFEIVDRLWGEAGVAFCLGPLCTAHLQTLISRWAGIETTVSLLLEAPTQLENTLELLQATDDEIFEVIANSPAKVVEFADNVDGNLTGKNLLRKYVLPYWSKRVSQLQSKGKLVGVHNDGRVRHALPVIIEAGFDFVEAVTPAPVGDLTLEEIKKRTEGKIAVIGGLPGALFSPLYSHEYFEGFVRKALSIFPAGESFVLGVADQVPPDGELSRVRLVREILEEESQRSRCEN
jgi:uroporphyrinogen-III decarboxylase